MSESRRTEGGLIINNSRKAVFFGIKHDDHGLILPDDDEIIPTSCLEAIRESELFFRDRAISQYPILALALFPRSNSDRLHIFPGQDMWRSYLEYYPPDMENRVPILLSHGARLAIEQAEVTTSVRTGISETEVEITDEQHARMAVRAAEQDADKELLSVDFDKGLAELLEPREGETEA